MVRVQRIPSGTIRDCNYLGRWPVVLLLLACLSSFNPYSSCASVWTKVHYCVATVQHLLAVRSVSLTVGPKLCFSPTKKVFSIHTNNCMDFIFVYVVVVVVAVFASAVAVGQGTLMVFQNFCWTVIVVLLRRWICLNCLGLSLLKIYCQIVEAGGMWNLSKTMCAACLTTYSI